MKELTAFSDLSTYIDSIGGMEHIIQKMARELVNDRSNYTMGTKSTRRTVEVKRPLVDRLGKLCSAVQDEIALEKTSNRYIDMPMPDPQFRYKDINGTTTIITLFSLQRNLDHAHSAARNSANYKLTPELATMFNAYNKHLKSKPNVLHQQ
jgi:hypothetical protein